MSAPETNIEKQQNRHKPALLGIGGAVIVALLLLVAFITFTIWQGGAPQGAEAQVDGRTGEITQTEASSN